MSKTFRRAAMSSICMLIVAVMTLTGATYAWFTQGDSATVDGMSMQVVSATGGIEVFNETTKQWANHFEVNLNKASVNPVSTADAETFVILDPIAPYNSENSEQIKVVTDHTVTVEGKEDKAPANVIIKTLKLRNTCDTEVTVDMRNSFIQDIENTSTQANKETSIGKAARIALITSEGTKVMAPYYSEVLAEGATEPTKTYTVDESKYNGINEDALTYATNGGYFYFRSDSGETPAWTVNTDCTDEVQLVDPKNATITLPGLSNGVPVEVEITIVIWLEGQDEDCVNTNAGGAFNIGLQFNRSTATIAMKDGSSSTGTGTTN